jgi:hypothetical protein
MAMMLFALAAFPAIVFAQSELPGQVIPITINGMMMDRWDQ